MFGLRSLRARMENATCPVTEVGWLINSQTATFLWSSPKPARRVGPYPKHAKNVNLCPAVVDHESRMFEVSCPFDLHLRIKIDEKGQAKLYDAAGQMSPVSPNLLAKMTIIDSPIAWRRPDRPVFQINTPYTFVADDPVYMSQMSPLFHYHEPPWPGVVIGGRVPIHIWPRTLSWAFEWWDVSKDLILRKGDPWFYVSFETADLGRRVRLVEAELTPELDKYMSGIRNVVHYTNRTFSLFGTAMERRPKRLLTKVARPPREIPVRVTENLPA